MRLCPDSVALQIETRPRAVSPATARRAQLPRCLLPSLSPVGRRCAGPVERQVLRAASGLRVPHARLARHPLVRPRALGGSPACGHLSTVAHGCSGAGAAKLEGCDRDPGPIDPNVCLLVLYRSSQARLWVSLHGVGRPVRAQGTPALDWGRPSRP